MVCGWCISACEWLMCECVSDLVQADAVRYSTMCCVVQTDVVWCGAVRCDEMCGTGWCSVVW